MTSRASLLARWLKRVSLVTGIAIAATTYADPPNLVQDGSFEDPSLPFGGLLFRSAGADWTPNLNALGPSVWTNAFLFAFHPPAVDGHQALWLPSGTSVRQTIPLQAGTIYDLSFYTTPERFTFVLPNISITLSDSSNAIVAQNTWGTTDPGSWTLETLNFTVPTTDNYTLKFAVQNTFPDRRRFGAALLDDITLTAQVPDVPATALLVGIGMIGVLAARRRLGSQQ